MTVAPGRKLEGLTFDQVEAEVKREYELVEAGQEFADNLSKIEIYRRSQDTRATGFGFEPWVASDFLTGHFVRADFTADDWVYHDTTVPQPTAAELKALVDNERREFTRDEIHTAVSMVIGRFYYSNADSHRLPKEVLSRLGFS